jgi:hypothetical protein
MTNLTNLTKLAPKDLTEALANSGYCGNLFRSARFDGWTESGDAIYAITFLNEDTDEIEDGFIYVRRCIDSGELLGEF